MYDQYGFPLPSKVLAVNICHDCDIYYTFSSNKLKSRSLGKFEADYKPLWTIPNSRTVGRNSHVALSAHLFCCVNRFMTVLEKDRGPLGTFALP